MPNKPIQLYLLSGSLAAACLLTAIVAWPFLLRNRDSLILLADANANIRQAQYARPYFRGAIALMRQEDALAVHLLADVDPHTQLARGQYAEALARQPNEWRAAITTINAEKPPLRYLLLKLLVPHLAELAPQELSQWRERLRDSDSLLLVDIALELLLQGNNDEAERWARAHPNYPASSDAQRIAGQANLNRGNYAQAEFIFKALYEQYPDPQNAHAYGRALLLAGKYRDSIIFLEQASIEASDQRSWRLADLGLAYALAGKCSKAHLTVLQGQALNQSAEFVARMHQVQDTIASVCD